jgi:sulfur-oxidizing protein SoxB
VSDPASAAAKPIVEYTWGKIWNAKAYNACSNMPRAGHMGNLNEKQIRDVMALLLDPQLPSRQQVRPCLFEPFQGSSSRCWAPAPWPASAWAAGQCRAPPRLDSDVRAAALRQRVAAAHDRLPCAAAAGVLPRARASTSASATCAARCRTWWANTCCAAAGVPPGTPHGACAHLPRLRQAARRYGKVGGFAHLATLVKQLKASRPGALLLDGGDTWQGSATALWTQAQDMVDACKLLGVDIMTGHWEFTYGMERVKEIIEKDFAGKIEFVAQNVKTADFGDPVFKPYVCARSTACPGRHHRPGLPVHAHRQPALLGGRLDLRHPGRSLQKVVDEVRGKGAQVVVLLSHNGMDVDLKLASRVTGIDAILGGHTHDGMPMPIAGQQRGRQDHRGQRRLQRQVPRRARPRRQGQARSADFRYTLLPVFADLLPADPEMDALITRVRAPYEAKLAKCSRDRRHPVPARQLQRHRRPAAARRADGRAGRGDRLFARLPLGHLAAAGPAITREWLMDMTATTYSYTTVTQMTGETLKTVLEDVADNLFNPDPYYQQGGDMVRVGGLQHLRSTLGHGPAHQDMRLGGKPIEAGRKYKVAGWAPVSEEARTAGNKPVWEVVEQWLKSRKVIATRRLDEPVLKNIAPNPGLS